MVWQAGCRTGIATACGDSDNALHPTIVYAIRQAIGFLQRFNVGGPRDCGFSVGACGGVGVEQRRLQLFGIVGSQPPGLGMVLTQNIAPFVLASTARARNIVASAKGAAVAASTSIFKHRGKGLAESCGRVSGNFTNARVRRQPRILGV